MRDVRSPRNHVKMRATIDSSTHVSARENGLAAGPFMLVARVGSRVVSAWICR